MAGKYKVKVKFLIASNDTNNEIVQGNIVILPIPNRIPVIHPLRVWCLLEVTPLGI